MPDEHHIPAPLAEDESVVAQRAKEANEQQRRLDTQLEIAHRLQLEAVAAIEEARRIMNFPFGSSVALEERKRG